jgi:hypothetical protein
MKEFYLLPDKVWTWIDQRPGFPLTVMQYDYHAEVGYEVDEKNSFDTFRPRKSFPEEQRAKAVQYDGSRFNEFAKEKFFERQLIYLMETKWLRPTITGMRIDGKGSKKINVVEASFGRQKFEYYLDPSSNLPTKVRITVWFDDLKTSSEDVLYLSDYVEIAGVKFPQVVSRGKGDDSKTTYLVNVPFKKNLFGGPPSIAAGPDAWKP